MNSLSWLLYGADVFGNLRGASAAVLIIGGIGVALSPIGFMIADLGPEDWLDSAKRLAGKFIFVGALAALFLVVTPSRNTIMLIAASEVGETVLASPQAQQIGGEAGELAADSLRVLRKFINEQLGGEE